MRVNEFIKLFQKIQRFKLRLEQENIKDQEQQIILKVYIEDLTNRINTKILKEVI